jgi:hypothetical protein
MTALEIKIAAFIAILLSLGGIGSYIHHEGYLSGKEEVIKSDKAALDKATTANTELINKLEVQRVQHQTELTNLRNAPVPVVPRVRFASCAKPTVASASSVQPIESNGLLSEAIGRVMDSDRQRTKGIVADAEQELTDCRTVKEWACHSEIAKAP